MTEFERHYYRSRLRNNVHSQLIKAVAESGLRKKEIARILGCNPSMISRWVNGTSNLTLDSISDILLALGMELDVEATPISKAQKRSEKSYK